MGDCPNPECHTKVDKHDRALFGKDGLIVCVQKKVTWKGLGAIATTLLFLFCTPMFYSIGAERKQNEKIVEIEIVKKDVEHIKEKVDKHDMTLDRIEVQQRVIIQNQISPEMLKIIMKEELKDLTND